MWRGAFSLRGASRLFFRMLTERVNGRARRRHLSIRELPCCAMPPLFCSAFLRGEETALRECACARHWCMFVWCADGRACWRVDCVLDCPCASDNGVESVCRFVASQLLMCADRRLTSGYADSLQFKRRGTPRARDICTRGVFVTSILSASPESLE